MPGPVVVKFGGSLLGSPELGALLAVAARHGAIVAPGGGGFADEVRAEQAAQGFDDVEAHRLAILAMDRTARLLAERRSELTLCASPADLSDCQAGGQGAIWLPSPMALAADVPASWDVTSDSLALWLAIELKASRLVLLKSAEIGAGGDPDAWSSSGLVDPYFARLAPRFRGAVAALGPARPDALDALLLRSERRAA